MYGYSTQFVEGIKAAKETDKYCSNNFIINASEFYLCLLDCKNSQYISLLQTSVVR
jgi:hypothetical protein